MKAVKLDSYRADSETVQAHLCIHMTLSPHPISVNLVKRAYFNININ